MVNRHVYGFSGEVVFLPRGSSYQGGTIHVVPLTIILIQQERVRKSQQFLCREFGSDYDSGGCAECKPECAVVS